MMMIRVSSAVAFALLLLDSSVNAFAPLSAPSRRRTSFGTSLHSSADESTILYNQNFKSSSWFQDWLAPVASASLLITGNTVGPGMLVLPELAQEPGLAATSSVLLGAYLMNLWSGLVLAQVSIHQHENGDREGGPVASFKEFAQVNLGLDASSLSGQAVATSISLLSLLVNACVLIFDIDRATSVIHLADHATVGIGWSLGFLGLASVLSNQALSQFASICVVVLFCGLGGVLLPGLASIQDPVSVLLEPGTAAGLGSVAHLAPVVLIAMVYQNIVPTICKMLNYDRTQVFSSITMGSGIPLALYWAWCFCSMGGGVPTDLSSAGWMSGLLTAFSLATLAGSTLGCVMSLAEEIIPILPTTESADKSTNSTTYPLQAVALSVLVPLAAYLQLTDFGACDCDLTAALSVAGSFGSPLLYGVLPALMAFHQQQQEKPVETTKRPLSGVSAAESAMRATLAQVTTTFQPRAEAVPRQRIPASAAGVGLLGVLSTTFVGEELFQYMTTTS